MASGIYKITNKSNGHCYIGSALNIQKRWVSHTSKLNRNIHGNRHLQFAWNKYGVGSFEFLIIEYCFPLALIFREQHWINVLHPEYNIAPKAGSSLGVKHTAEFSEKISKRMKGNSINTGRKLTEEHRLKIGMAQVGRHPDPTTRIKLAEWQVGRKLSKEHRAKLSVAKKGNKQSPEAIAKRSAANTGKKRTPETKAKMSAAWIVRRLTKKGG